MILVRLDAKRRHIKCISCSATYQAIMMALVTFTENAWNVHYEGVMYNPHSNRQRPDDLESGVDELDGFAFGYPTAIPLQDGTFLAANWSNENGICGIRWTKLSIDW